MRLTFVALVTGCIGGGCAIQPLPQDVTHLDTYAIVAQVRCEVRDALRYRVDKAIRRRPEDARLADELLKGSLSYNQLLGRIMDPDLKGVLEQYAGATIGYDFSLDMTESNNVSASATLTRPIVRGTDTIGFSVGSDHKRENTRTFTIDDTFQALLTQVPDSYCHETTDHPNFNYPITGRTRLADTVVTFLDLNQSGNLGMKKGGPSTPTLTDDLQFTTTYTGNVSPGFLTTPIGTAFALSAIGGKVEDTRSDIHRVTVALAMPEKGKKPTAAVIAQSRQDVRGALANAANNRFQVYVQKISDGLSAPTTNSILSLLLP